MFRVLVMSSVLALFTTATHATQAVEQPEVGQDQGSIVGSWIGINETGERWLTSFTSDGIVLSSLQSEVSVTRPVGVLTPGHGVWAHLGHKQFAVTEMAIFYDIQTGEYQSTGKLRGVLTLDEGGDALSGTVTVDAIGPDGNVVFSLTHSLRFVRIKVEPVD
jgi:hypothetical protein